MSDIKKEKDCPPEGTYYMYPCYDRDNNLIGFSLDYEARGAFGELCEIVCKGIWKKQQNIIKNDSKSNI